MKVGEQLRDTIRAHRKGGNSRTTLNDRTQEVLDSVELEASVMDRYPHELSGGMKQRVCVAMAILLNPKVIIADEPTSALDVTVQAEVIEVLRELRDRHGTTLLFISHDLAVISELADSVTIMKQGRVVESGPTSAVLGSPREDYTRALLAAVPVIGRRSAS
jgi:ABC-type dipeptide/oligopeptide/nickel transport system ATPase component